MAPGSIERRLLNDYQRNFPLESRPFLRVAEELGVEEADVLDVLGDLVAKGTVCRVGAVVRPNTVGASTLAAMAVPAPRLDAVAAAVSARPEVNHNYEREHALNLWFVVTAADAEAVKRVVGEIEAETGLPVLALPLLESYHIDLGFDLGGARFSIPVRDADADAPPDLDAADIRLLAALEDGLAIVPCPYAALGLSAGLAEREAIERLGCLVAARVVRRLGVVVRHRELGYTANAMVVWDVADADAADVGRRLAGFPFVTLCYRRSRRLPLWPYNLFCMIHGRDRDTVRGQIALLDRDAGLAERPTAVLFSRRRFKQRGARYLGARAA